MQEVWGSQEPGRLGCQVHAVRGTVAGEERAGHRRNEYGSTLGG